MRRLPVIFLFSLLPLLAKTQSNIRGRVVVEGTGKPLPGSSVFIANSAKGSTSNAEGYFELNNIPPGRHDLIISFVGYETNVYSFSSEQLPLQLRVEMKLKEQVLENVTVEPSVEEGWDKWGNTFTENFIGRSEFARHCTIRNTGDIRFRFFRKSNRLIAYSDNPVVVENKDLGYLLHFQLEDFEVNFRERSMVFTGYPLFEEMKTSRRGLREKWEENRRQAYFGSMMHFMRNVYRNALDSSGFTVRRLIRRPNLEKQRVAAIYRNRMVKDGQIVISSGTIGPMDSSAYYERVLRQPDLLDEFAPTLLTADSLVAATDGNYKAIRFSNHLQVIYSKAPEEKAYLEFWMEKRKPGPQVSMITLLNTDEVWTDINGSYVPARGVFSGGYWGWSEKIARLLPLEYEPGDER